MSSQKRKLHSDDAEASPSKKKTKHASPSKKKTKHAKIFPKAHKRPRSLFETQIIISSGKSDPDFQDDAGNDTDWIAETQSKCLSSEGERDRNEATDASTGNAEKVTQGLKKKKKMKRTKKGKKEMKTAVCRKREEGVTHKNGRQGSAEEETCDICMRVLRSKYDMKRHKKGHAQCDRYETATGVYKCLNCLKCYDDINQLRVHRRCYCPLNAMGEKKDGAEDGGTSKDAQQSKSESMFKCDTCSAQFESFSDLQAHSARHRRLPRRQPSVRCPKCSKVFCSFHKLKVHNTVVHINKGLKVYKCKLCDQGFGSETQLRYHKRDKHGKDGVTYKCHYCHLIFETWQLRQHHIGSTHAGNYLCEYCGNPFKKTIAAYHRRKCKMNPQNQQQSKKQTFVNAAPSCSKETSSNVASVSSPESLQPESVTSLALRKPKAECYECKKCLITFESRNNYVIHQRTCQLVAEKTINRVYICEACQEIFSTILKLRAHESEHLSVICKDCNEVVPDEETLEMHVLLECPERYKLFSNKTHREETDANRDLAEVVETTQENEKSSNSVDSSPTTCTDINVGVKQMNDILGDKKPSISGIVVGKAVNKENASSDDKNNQTHDGRGAIVCKMCSRKFKTIHLKQHAMAHKKDTQRQSKTGQFECLHCFNRYDVKSNLSVHRRFFCPLQDLKEDYIGHTCGICHATFENVDLLSIHQMIHVVHVTVTEDDKRIKLRKESENITDVEFDEVNSEGLDKKDTSNDGTEHDKIDTDIQDNIQSKLMDDSKQWEVSQNICSNCNVEFTSVAALKEHQKRVSMTKSKYPHGCPICPGVMSRRPLIVSACDYLQHKKQFKFLCQFCGEHFENGLERHIKRFHDYENKKECPGCHQIFGLQEYQEHVEYNRKEVERLNCKCLSCGKVFVRPSVLDTHTKRFNIKCNICWQHFQDGDSLAEHRKQSHNVSTKCKSKKGHWCKHCDKFFDKASLLSAHVKSVLEEESSESLLCSWEYKYSTCLRCGITYTKDSDYKLHKFIWRHECLNCHCHFQSEKQLRGHYQRIHATRGNVGTDFCSMRQISHVQRRRNKQRLAIISCKFCHSKITRTNILRHAKPIDEKCEACGIKLYSTCLKRIHMKNICREKCQCTYCGAQFKSMSHKNDHESGYSPLLGQARCSVCCVDLACCQITDHRQHVEDRMKGKRCAYCLEVIPSEGRKIPQHQKLQNKLYLCSCGETIEATCQKKLQEKFVCCKCGTHFVQYQDLVTHLVKYNIGNVNTTNTTAEDNSRQMSKKSLMEIETWNTLEEEGKTIYVCLYCRDKVDTYEEMMEHKSTFKYECPQCKKHFRTPLAASHHFKQVNHVTCRSKGKQFKETSSKKTVGPMSVKKRQTLNVKDDILTIYWQQAVCDELYQQYKESEQHSERMTFQIGFEEYSILPTNPANVKEDIALDDSKAQNGCPVSINELHVPQRASESSPNATKSILTSCEANSVEPHTTEESESNFKVTYRRAMGKKHMCIHCKKQFTTIYTLARHLQHSKGLLYTCTKCDRSFDVMCSLEYHIARMCKHCGIHFSEVEVMVDHEQQCKNEKGNKDSNISSALSKDEREDVLYVASVKESRSQAVEDEELMRTAVETDDGSDEETDSASKAEGIEAVSKSESEKKGSSVQSKGEDVDAVKGGTPTEKDNDDDVNTNLQIVRTVEGNDAMMDSEEVKEVLTHQNDHEDEKLMTDAVETDESKEETGTAPEAEGMEVVSRNEVEEGGSFVQSKHDNVDAVKDGTPTEKKNDDATIDFEIEKAGEGNDAMMDSEAGKEVLSHQNDHGRKSNRVRKEFLIMSLTKPVTRKGNLQKRAMTDEKKCEFCLKKKLNKNSPCYQNDVFLKWMRCVCLYCNLELPSKCHIHYHLDRVERYTTKKCCCGKHFTTRKHSDCKRCDLCVDIYFGSKNDLEMHITSWHKIVYEEIPVTRGSSDKCGSTDQRNPLNKITEHEATNITTKPDAAESSQPVSRKRKQSKLEPKKSRKTKAIGEKARNAPIQVALTVTSDGVKSTSKPDAAESSQPVGRKRKQNKQDPTKRQRTTKAIGEKAHKAPKQVALTVTSDGLKPTQASNAAMPGLKASVSLPTARVHTYVLPTSDSQQEHHQFITQTSQSELNSQNTAVVLQESIQQVSSSPLEIQKPMQRNQMPVTQGGVNPALPFSLSTKIQDVPISTAICGSERTGLGPGLISVPVSAGRIHFPNASEDSDPNLTSELEDELTSVLASHGLELKHLICVKRKKLNLSGSLKDGLKPTESNAASHGLKSSVSLPIPVSRSTSVTATDSHQEHHQLLRQISQESIHQLSSSPVTNLMQRNSMPVTHDPILPVSLSTKIQGVPISKPAGLIAVGSGRVNLAGSTYMSNLTRGVVKPSEVAQALVGMPPVYPNQIFPTTGILSSVPATGRVHIEPHVAPKLTRVLTNTNTVRGVNILVPTHTSGGNPSTSVVTGTHPFGKTSTLNVATKQVSSALAGTTKQVISKPPVPRKDVTSMLCAPVDGMRKQNTPTCSTSVSLAKGTNLSAAKTNVAVVPGGLEELSNIELAAEKSSIRKILLVFGEKAANHFVEYITINNQSYLTFNYPASHTGILNAGKQNDEKFSVMIMDEDQNSKPSCEMGSPRRALVVKIGPHKLHTIEKSNDLSGDYTYMVELIKTLPVTSKQVNSYLPIRTNQVTSRPLATTKQVNSIIYQLPQ
ncbi:uncharacterized protein [Amphiura filiformis]|uniref:uncharacterized protein n=1 Tax=Amphiura filiformis TaxID=82378 RepID=UPI003B21E573